MSLRPVCATGALTLILLVGHSSSAATMYGYGGYDHDDPTTPASWEGSWPGPGDNVSEDGEEAPNDRSGERARRRTPLGMMGRERPEDGGGWRSGGDDEPPWEDIESPEHGGGDASWGYEGLWDDEAWDDFLWGEPEDWPVDPHGAHGGDHPWGWGGYGWDPPAWPPSHHGPGYCPPHCYGPGYVWRKCKVPEPSGLALAGSLVAGVALRRRRG